MKPTRSNYFKAIEIAEDVSKLTGLDRAVVKAVLKTTSMVIAHYIAEGCLSDDIDTQFCAELPYVGTLDLTFIDDKPSTKALNYDIKLTDTFYNYLLKARVDKHSPLEDAVAKKFVDVFIDKYKSIV